MTVFSYWQGVSFFGPRSEYVVSGSDCGHVFIWSKEGGELQTFLFADDTGLDEPIACTYTTTTHYYILIAVDFFFFPFLF